MKKFAVVLSIAVLTVSAYSMSKTPADATAADASKACEVKAACPACTVAGGTCAACKAKADVTKASCEMKADAAKAVSGADKAVKDAGCTTGVCPLKK